MLLSLEKKPKKTQVICEVTDVCGQHDSQVRDKSWGHSIGISGYGNMSGDKCGAVAVTLPSPYVIRPQALQITMQVTMPDPPSDGIHNAKWSPSAS